MILVETFDKAIPQRYIDALLPASKDEYYNNPEEREAVLKTSDKIVGIYNSVPCAVLGVIPLGLISGGHRMWFLPCKGLKDNVLGVARTIKKLRKEHLQYVVLTAAIDKENKKNRKFVEMFGFYPAEAVLDTEGKFELFRMGVK